MSMDNQSVQRLNKVAMESFVLQGHISRNTDHQSLSRHHELDEVQYKSKLVVNKCPVRGFPLILANKIRTESNQDSSISNRTDCLLLELLTITAVRTTKTTNTSISMAMNMNMNQAPRLIILTIWGLVPSMEITRNMSKHKSLLLHNRRISKACTLKLNASQCRRHQYPHHKRIVHLNRRAARKACLAVFLEVKDATSSRKQTARNRALTRGIATPRRERNEAVSSDATVVTIVSHPNGAANTVNMISLVISHRFHRILAPARGCREIC